MDSLTIPHARPTIRAIAAALSGVLVMSLVLVGTIAFGAKSTAVSFVDYAQCADGTADDAATNCPGSWINGILQASNSTYHEDEVTPQRAELLVPTGASLTGHSFTFSYQTRKGSALCTPTTRWRPGTTPRPPPTATRVSTLRTGRGHRQYLPDPQ